MAGPIRGFGGTTGIHRFDEIFESFRRVRGEHPAPERRGPVQGRDLRYDLTIDLNQAVFGAEIDIEVHAARYVLRLQGDRRCAGTASPQPRLQCTGQLRQVRQTFLGSMVNIVDAGAAGGQVR
jgi:molecular chaperone DnaJ